jgi:predicted small secreted protein
MKKIVFLGSLLTLLNLILSGCATTQGYEQKVNSWMGLSESQLIRSWGVPQQTFTSEGSRYFVYNSSRNVYLPGTTPTYTANIVGNIAYINSYGGSAPQNLNFSCSTTFQLKNHKVVSWRFKGNDCTAPEVPDVAKMIKKELSKELPKKIDNYTTLTTIQNKGTTLIYTFEIDAGTKRDNAIRKEDYMRMKNAVTKGICNTSIQLLQQGVNISYLYISSNSKAKLFRFDVNKSSCK